VASADSGVAQPQAVPVDMEVSTGASSAALPLTPPGWHPKTDAVEDPPEVLASGSFGVIALERSATAENAEIELMAAYLKRQEDLVAEGQQKEDRTLPEEIHLHFGSKTEGGPVGPRVPRATIVGGVVGQRHGGLYQYVLAPFSTKPPPIKQELDLQPDAEFADSVEGGSSGLVVEIGVPDVDPTARAAFHLHHPPPAIEGVFFGPGGLLEDVKRGDLEWNCEACTRRVATKDCRRCKGCRNKFCADCLEPEGWADLRSGQVVYLMHHCKGPSEKELLRRRGWNARNPNPDWYRQQHERDTSSSSGGEWHAGWDQDGQSGTGSGSWNSWAPDAVHGVAWGKNWAGHDDRGAKRHRG
jgi:hypothetical protein